MAKAKPARLKLDAIKGVMPVLQFALPDQLLIDRTYQRSIEGEDSQRLIRSIAQGWDWDLCQPLVVSRRGDGSLYVIDGQHRLAAAKLRGDIQQLPCVIVTFDDTKGEAASFVNLNQRRRPLSKLDLFKAAVASGEAKALAILQAIEDAGLSIAPHSNFTAWKPGMISNIGGIEASVKRHGSDVTAVALKMLARAFRGEVLQYAGTIYPGIAGACALAMACGDTLAPATFAEMANNIGKIPQARWRQDILTIRAVEGLGGVPAAEIAVKRMLWPSRFPQPADIDAVPAPVAREAAVIAVPVNPSGMAWCEQCDRQVRPDAVATCQSRFCSLKREAA